MESTPLPDLIMPNISNNGNTARIESLMTDFASFNKDQLEEVAAVGLSKTIIWLDSIEADKVAFDNGDALTTFDPGRHFQVELVTFLKFCGGNPSTIKTIIMAQELV